MGFSSMYARLSYIQPLFHFRPKPGPEPPVGLVTPGHAVDFLGDHHDAGVALNRRWRSPPRADGLEVLAPAVAFGLMIIRFAR
jgi:hypothetical protein